MMIKPTYTNTRVSIYVKDTESGNITYRLGSYCKDILLNGIVAILRLDNKTIGLTLPVDTKPKHIHRFINILNKIYGVEITWETIESLPVLWIENEIPTHLYVFIIHLIKHGEFDFYSDIYNELTPGWDLAFGRSSIASWLLSKIPNDTRSTYMLSSAFYAFLRPEEIVEEIPKNIGCAMVIELSKTHRMFYFVRVNFEWFDKRFKEQLTTHVDDLVMCMSETDWLLIRAYITCLIHMKRS